MTPTPDKAELLDELVWVARRRLRAVFKQPDGEDEQKYPQLARITKEAAPEIWQDDPNWALVLTMRDALEKLPDTTAWKCAKGCTWKLAGEILYGFRPKDVEPRPDGQPHTYRDYVAALRKTSGYQWSDRDFGRLTSNLRGLLADNLIALEINPPQIGTFRRRIQRTRHEPTSVAGYVPRMKLEAKVSAAVNEADLVALVGEGGTGKTTLARSWAITHAGAKNMIFIDASDQQSMLRSIIAEFDRLELSIDELTETTMRQRLKQLIRDKQRAPALIVFDNLNDWHASSQVLAPGHISTVLVTARHQVLPRGRGVYVPVSSLTDDEAVTMIESRLPNVSNDELGKLSLLRGRALAIDQVCAYLREHTIEERASFLTVLDRHLVAALDVVAAELGESALRNIYHEIMAALDEHGETRYAARLLELIAFTSGKDVPVDVLERALIDIGGLNNPQLGHHVYLAAEAVLKRYHLIDVVPDTTQPDFNDFKYYGKYVSMHPLTKSLLADLAAGSLTERCRQLIAATINAWDDYGERQVEHEEEMRAEKRRAWGKYYDLGSFPPGMTTEEVTEFLAGQLRHPLVNSYHPRRLRDLLGTVVDIAHETGNQNSGIFSSAHELLENWSAWLDDGKNLSAPNSSL